MKRAFRASLSSVAVVTAVLLALAGISWALSTTHIPGWWSVVLALAIAAVKITLVMLFFMELGEHRGGLRYAALAGPAFLAVLILLVLGDVWTR